MLHQKPFFGEREVIRELCKARIKLAVYRHEKQFLHNIRPSNDSTPIGPQTWGAIPLDIFPPRRRWHSFRLKWRRREGVPRPSNEVNTETLFRAVIALKESNPTAPWAIRLDAVVAQILRRTFDDPQFAFATPVIIPAEKNSEKHEYRPLAQYPLEDKIIDCLVARYLREALVVPSATGDSFADKRARTAVPKVLVAERQQAVLNQRGFWKERSWPPRRSESFGPYGTALRLAHQLTESKKPRMWRRSAFLQTLSLVNEQVPVVLPTCP